jgi:hypothetical protein
MGYCEVMVLVIELIILWTFQYGNEVSTGFLLHRLTCSHLMWLEIEVRLRYSKIRKRRNLAHMRREIGEHLKILLVPIKF